MQKADYLLRLMKQQTDALVAKDEKLQQFLMWVNEKSLSVEVPYKPAAVRAFYFGLDRALDRTLERTLDPTFERTLDIPLDIPLAFDRALLPGLVPAFDRALDRALDHALDRALDLARALNCALDAVLVRALAPELKRILQALKEQLPDPDSDWEIFKQWWKANGKGWTEQLRAVMIKHRNIGHDWKFSSQQKEVLKQYYDANKLLVDCLNSSCNVTPAVRWHIEDTLLLPIVEIEQRGSWFDK